MAGGAGAELERTDFGRESSTLPDDRRMCGRKIRVRLAFDCAMLKGLYASAGGQMMTQMTADRARNLARNLMEILTSYEEELIALERETPAIGQLRRAVGITIAEACYMITDDAISEWIPPSDGQARRAR